MTDTFVTFYRNGKYLYSKSIDYSFEHIYDKYCELVGERVDEEEFFSILESEGLKTIHADYQQNLMKLFGEIFIQINDIIIYVKRAHDLTTIEQMFIGSVKGPIIGLDEYSENYLGLQSSELNFDFGFESEEWYTDQLQYMLASLAITFHEDSEAVANLSIFHRAPPFPMRPSGQFIIATALAIMAVSLIRSII
jgi:Tfp pilus assembly PilM family ATPase